MHVDYPIPRACPGPPRVDDLALYNKVGNPLGWGGVDNHKIAGVTLWAGPNLVCKRCLTAREGHPHWVKAVPDQLEIFSLARGAKLGLTLIEESKVLNIIGRVPPDRAYVLRSGLVPAEVRSTVRRAIDQRIALFSKHPEAAVWTQP